jgi:hypothetical protein
MSTVQKESVMTSWTVTAPEKFEMSPAEVGSIDVRLTAGRLSIVGTDGPPRVEIGRIAETPITVDLRGGRLTVAQEAVCTWPGMLAPVWWFLNGGKKFDADVSIAVPYETECRLFLASGSLVASSLHSDVKADVVSGRMTLFGLDGEVRAKVVSGPIESLGCAGLIELETISGEITLADSAASRVHIKTVSGALTADLDNPPFDSQIRLETVSGEITIRVREDSDLRVALAAAHGRVASDFPGMSVEGRWGSKVAGTLGAGSGLLVANAVGGNISLLRREVDADFGEES